MYLILTAVAILSNFQPTTSSTRGSCETHLFFKLKVPPYRELSWETWDKEHLRSETTEMATNKCNAINIINHEYVFPQGKHLLVRTYQAPGICTRYECILPAVARTHPSVRGRCIHRRSRFRSIELGQILRCVGDLSSRRGRHTS